MGRPAGSPAGAGIPPLPLTSVSMDKMSAAGTSVSSGQDGDRVIILPPLGSQWVMTARRGDMEGSHGSARREDSPGPVCCLL